MDIQQRIARDLSNIGIEAGDTLVVRVSLRNVLSEEERKNLSINDRKMYFFNALQEVLGSKGTLMVLAFTRQFFWPFIPKDYVFSINTEPTTGALTKLILERGDARRSGHPTNSFAAIGPLRDFLLEGHDQRAAAYAPIGKLIECGGKFLNIGVDPQSPGFTTAHWAQYRLGLANQFRFRMGVNYLDEFGAVRFFWRKDVGGCSASFSKFYPLYREQNLIREGLVGRAQAMLMIDTKSAFQLELNTLKENATFPFCDSESCLSCRLGWKYAPASPVKFMRQKIMKRLRGHRTQAASMG